MCEIGEKFSNLTYYNDCMKKSMVDKLFFIDHLPKNQDFVFVDFGCADGTMINFLTELYNGEKQENVYIGYDISDQMIDIAKTNYHGPMNFDVSFTTSWDNVVEKMKSLGSIRYKKVLILSSVIHEVYSYGDVNSIHDFWEHVINSDFDYICVRDMCPYSDIDRNASYSDINKIYMKSDCNWQIDHFENIFGKITNQKNLIHFLLKYRWKINWTREVHENYFPIYVGDLIDNITSNRNYTIDYLERFRVPFLDKCIKEDFDIELKDFTHIKAIFTKKH